MDLCLEFAVRVGGAVLGVSRESGWGCAWSLP